jgi:hypothetical protein
MMMDIDRAAKAIRDAEIEDFIEGFNQPPSAVCGSVRFGSLRGRVTTGGSVYGRGNERIAIKA